MINNEQFSFPSSSFDKIPVWVIEDDKMLNQTVTRSLTKEGYTCQNFYSGREVLDWIDSLENPEAEKVVLLLDYLLEDMDARGFLAALKNRKLAYPFIMMTAYGDEKTAVSFMKAGAMDYIIKEKEFIHHIVRAMGLVQEKLDMNRKLEASRLELRQNAEKLKKLNEQISLQKVELENEKHKTDKLLQTILPEKVARELLEHGFTRPRYYNSVSILFADVVGFSDLAKKHPPIDLVSHLDNYFYVFDEIMEQFGLEKIKTIGDCYMCAGGIPEENPANAILTVLAGLKLQKAAMQLAKQGNTQLGGFSLRLGIHTGPVVAGVVGKNKFAYDIWGDAVNIAARIVEAGEPDKVNVSEQSYALIRDYFVYTKRGNVLTKRNIPIKMYFIERLKPEYSADCEGLTPSKSLLKEMRIKQGVRYF